MAQIKWTVAGLLAALTTQVYAQYAARNWTITASTCVAPNAFTQCVNALQPFNNQCISAAGTDNNKILACACVGTLGYLNCAMANCWNVVYGCEYQALASLYTDSCADPVPFFPAPENAPGGCSCNLGYVLYNNTNVAFEYRDCISSDVTQNDGCSCCYQAAGYAALYGICPNTQPALVVPAQQDGVYDVSDPNLKQGHCASYFAKYDCSSLGFTGLGVPFMTSYDAATIGKQTLSNSNTRTLTSPASGATFTWTDLGIAYTVTAASANARATTGSSSSGRATGTSAAATGATGSSSGSASSVSTATSNAYRVSNPQVLSAALAGIAALICLIL